ncbi:MAG: ABC transporter [Rhodobacterales bacterium 32-66-7]|nr:MAG: ABC transporter [Rhodobacterales bacterium 12-65-15]OYX23405.1 MAG: ABC transporter [Rhodobacterales bacterium 32-66-7]
MSGLLALLDDVAAIAKLAAASVDDIAAAAAKAGAKAAGVVIDDAAVTPKYVQGFEAKRELPIIWRIARGSMKNKLLFLLPALLALDQFLPVAITPLLMLGGAYLCFEGAEKVVHALAPHADETVKADFDTKDPAHLEEEKVAGAIKTDFILSAEIMTIALATIESPSFWMQAITLAVVGAMITIVVYGAVALIVKMDDVGLHLAATGRTGAGRALGRGLVLAMPKLMAFLSVVGTAAMLWVGGNIVLHGLEVTHLWAWPYDMIQDIATQASRAVGTAQGFVEWAVTAALDGVFGLILGAMLIPVATKVIMPAYAALTGAKPPAR